MGLHPNPDPSNPAPPPAYQDAVATHTGSIPANHQHPHFGPYPLPPHAPSPHAAAGVVQTHHQGGWVPFANDEASPPTHARHAAQAPTAGAGAGGGASGSGGGVVAQSFAQQRGGAGGSGSVGGSGSGSGASAKGITEDLLQL